MADKHPSGNPDLIEQHKKVQHQGDRELAGTARREPKKPAGEVQEDEGAPGADSDNSGSRSDGGSFVGP